MTAQSSQTVEAERQWWIDTVSDAKASRTAKGVVDATLDAQYDRVMSGDFSGLMILTGGVSQSAGRATTGVKVSGTGAVAPTYSYEATSRGNGSSSNRPAPKRGQATPKMLSYIRGLLDQRQHLYAAGHPIHKAATDGMSFDMASKTINFLKAQPYKLASQRSAPVAPDQNYQIPGSNSLGESTEDVPVQPAPRKVSAWEEWRTLSTPLLPFERFATTGKDGQTKFWRVFEYTRQSDGRKFTILRTVSGASGEQGHWTEKMAPEAMVSVARQIHAAGIKESATRYGKETGRCSDCNRLLTDPVSRENGIGPVCAAKGHWA